jgi:hypothetical protein
MSRTDHTDPHWIRAPWWEPWHTSCQYAMFYRGEVCDLPAEPVLKSTYGSTWRSRNGATRCRWVPGHDYTTPCYTRGAAAEFIRVAFTKPERRRVRDQLARARAEYRATSEVDVVASTEQHRHRGLWAWW